MLDDLADAVLVLHLAVVVFIVGGLLFIVLGNLRSWQGANSPAFRWAHVAAICAVVAQSWLGLECPLTTLENFLRAQAGGSGYGVGFIAHWVSALLFWQAPNWVFALIYTAFGTLVAGAWLAWPPRRIGR